MAQDLNAFVMTNKRLARGLTDMPKDMLDILAKLEKVKTQG